MSPAQLLSFRARGAEAPPPRCPSCGAAVNLLRSKAEGYLAEPTAKADPETPGYCTSGVIIERPRLATIAACPRCEWCGFLEETEHGSKV